MKFCFDALNQRRFSEHGRSLRLLEHRRDPRIRKLRIQRHIRTAGMHDRQHRGDQGIGAVRKQTDFTARFDLPEQSCDLDCFLLQLTAGYSLSAADKRRRFRFGVGQQRNLFV